MAHRTVLTDRQRAALFDLPTDEASMLHHYTLSDDDLEIIRAVAVPTTALALPCNSACCDIPGVCWGPAR
ncbi:DUF4158 domain-containing protein [Sedimentitalea sp. JM2-8]|uniref:DUF4158 domain-containing protein n=1 Tax=Sedimentitalea xiamensis TaxID=3050037 RepID=A0ABT7FLJ6_9RHOB|nr:DUF4158 domain-containing protein [Sedimentitalea xiamensis]MDK3075885.1 DUF4158 domain-containing protein [Sedimentitalea xiamensis]